MSDPGPSLIQDQDQAVHHETNKLHAFRTMLQAAYDGLDRNGDVTDLYQLCTVLSPIGPCELLTKAVELANGLGPAPRNIEHIEVEFDIARNDLARNPLDTLEKTAYRQVKLATLTKELKDARRWHENKLNTEGKERIMGEIKALLLVEIGEVDLAMRVANVFARVNRLSF